MGGAILRSWTADHNQPSHDIAVIDPNRPDFIGPGIDHFTTAEAARKFLSGTDILVLAVKPQIMAETCRELGRFTGKSTVILSIAAGITTASLSEWFGGNAAVIRAMPNLPASIGRGITALFAQNGTSANAQKLAESLMAAAGGTAWIADEELMDAVTALSGSGPAYIFYLIEALSLAGQALGMPEETSFALARHTVTGSAALAEAESNTPAETLRRNVTSPGGTTEAALKVLMDGRFQALLDEALRAACDRGKELR